MKRRNPNPTNPLNECGGCGKDFAALEYFDAHRVGEYGPGIYTGPVEDWAPERGRRCLRTEELRERGFELDERGRWYGVARRQRGMDALATSLAEAA
jgi:hypothetical protein